MSGIDLIAGNGIKEERLMESRTAGEIVNGVPGHLRHLGVLRVAGPDAFGFLQGQISNDTGRLQAGTPLLAACSTPQGRVFSILRLLPHSSGILGILPRELVVPTAERLRKYVLRSKVRIEDASDEFAVAGHYDPAALGAAALPLPTTGVRYVESEGIGVALAGAADSTRTGGTPPASTPPASMPPASMPPVSGRYWVVGPPARLAAMGLAGNLEDAGQIEHDWRLGDIVAGSPQVYAGTSELFVAQMLNLDLLDGISFSKGCFTGQEIIARTQHLGRIKRRMLRLRLPDGDWRIGGPVRLVDGRSGRLTEVVRHGNAFEALAVLPIDAASKDTDLDAQSTPGEVPAVDAAGHAGLEVPLPYALSAAS
jgi:folate-binding protein YgfZ